jgi:hypothetical protein
MPTAPQGRHQATHIYKMTGAPRALYDLSRECPLD